MYSYSYSTQVWLAHLDKHQTSKPVMVSWEFNSHWRQFYYRPQRSCESYVFTGVCLSTGGGVPGPGRGLSAPGGGVFAPRGCLVRGGVCSGELVSLHTLRQTPPPRERGPLLRTIRILLECILVFYWNLSKPLEVWLYKVLAGNMSAYGFF